MSECATPGSPTAPAENNWVPSTSAASPRASPAIQTDSLWGEKRGPRSRLRAGATSRRRRPTGARPPRSAPRSASARSTAGTEKCRFTGPAGPAWPRTSPRLTPPQPDCPILRLPNPSSLHTPSPNRISSLRPPNPTLSPPPKPSPILRTPKNTHASPTFPVLRPNPTSDSCPTPTSGAPDGAPQIQLRTRDPQTRPKSAAKAGGTSRPLPRPRHDSGFDKGADLARRGPIWRPEDGPPRACAAGASGSFGRGRGAHLSLLLPPRLCRLRSGMVRLAWMVALGLSLSFSLAKQWLLRIRCREDFTIRPLGSETRKTSAAPLRAAAAARRSQNGAAAAARLYRRRARATPPAPPGTRPHERQSRGAAGKNSHARPFQRLIGGR